MMTATTMALVTIVKVLVLYLAVIHVAPIMLWVERKGAALIQDRPGPNRVGPFGLFQPIADFVKLLMKENEPPASVNRLLYYLAPFLTLIPASLVIAALPFADYAMLFDTKILIQIADIDVGILYMLAISSLGIYGILFGGWASNNKFSIIGAMRSASQIISYEIPLGLAAVGTVMIYGTFSLREMTYLQTGLIQGVFPNWGIFYQPLGFLVFFVAAFAETNRLPFDLPETEAELVAGFHTEYGSMNFATFFMAEYMNMATLSGLMTVLYFGGWHIPYVSDESLLAMVGSQNILALIQFATFFFKIAVFMIIFVWVRWTLPRFRFDQLMRLTWQNLIPLSLINIVVTAVVMYWRFAP